MKYELKENKFGKYFIKNNKYHYLSQYDRWGLDKTIWHDTIDYGFYKVKFLSIDNVDYIQLSKNKETKRLEQLFN